MSIVGRSDRIWRKQFFKHTESLKLKCLKPSYVFISVLNLHTVSQCGVKQADILSESDHMIHEPGHIAKPVCVGDTYHVNLWRVS